MKKLATILVIACICVFVQSSSGHSQWVVCPETSCYVVCPSGDLSFCYCIGDALGDPLTLPPASVFLKIVCNSGDLYICPGESLIKASFLRHLPCVVNPGCGAEYCWQFQLGGCCGDATISIHLEDPGAPAIYTHNVMIKSPDYSGDGTVDLIDFAYFSAAIYPEPYDPCFDLNCDGMVDIQDVDPGNPLGGIFGVHYLHNCNDRISTESSSWGRIKSFYTD